MLDPIAEAKYVLGPAFIEYDHKIRTADPLLQTAKPIMKYLISQTKGHAVAMLARVYRDQVMCVHQEVGELFETNVSYERGLKRPMYKGATSKIILAYLSTKNLRRLYEQDAEQIRLDGLGSDWNEFKAALKLIRKAGSCVSYGEVDANNIGIAVPVMREESEVLGSLSLVLDANHVDERAVTRLIPVLLGAAKELELDIARGDATHLS
ncbi:MAG: hypothetical protein OQK09_07570 [Colwellia sp.]|nr:hypothetical protein [Colwellia sp.]MCW9081358.1 hypothetical protein [Colwellia sp.]